MATITAQGQPSEVTLVSRSSVGSSTWSEPTGDVVFTLNLPKYSVVDSAVLTFHATSGICGNSNLAVDGVKVGANGNKSVAISVANEAASKKVTFSFKGSGSDYETSVVTVSNMVLTVTYHISYICPFRRAEGGSLVSYKLYRAEGGSLVLYSLYRAENGALVKY